MKEVRLNDKLWFGKYKGERISALIKSDASYIQKILKEGIISMDDKCKNLFEDAQGIRHERRIMFPDPEIIIGDESAVRYTGTIENFTTFKNIISGMIIKLIRNQPPDIIISIINFFIDRMGERDFTDFNEIKITNTPGTLYLSLYLLKDNVEIANYRMNE